MQEQQPYSSVAIDPKYTASLSSYYNSTQPEQQRYSDLDRMFKPDLSHIMYQPSSH